MRALSESVAAENAMTLMEWKAGILMGLDLIRFCTDLGIQSRPP
jgi:hypothetical protein